MLRVRVRVKRDSLRPRFELSECFWFVFVWQPELTAHEPVEEDPIHPVSEVPQVEDVVVRRITVVFIAAVSDARFFINSSTIFL